MSDERCDQEVFDNGVVIALLAESSREELDQICKHITKVFKAKTDWHMYCGRYSIKTIELDKEIIEEMHHVIYRMAKVKNFLFYNEKFANPIGNGAEYGS